MGSTTFFSEVRLDNEVESPTAFSMKTCLGTQQPGDYWPLLSPALITQKHGMWETWQLVAARAVSLDPLVKGL